MQSFIPHIRQRSPDSILVFHEYPSKNSIQVLAVYMIVDVGVVQYILPVKLYIGISFKQEFGFSHYILDNRQQSLRNVYRSTVAWKAGLW